ncbi:hypothetical protein [Halorussus amylolyticus]|nr:hypothetical protein [Halorussus amylolyticus]
MSYECTTDGDFETEDRPMHTPTSAGSGIESNAETEGTDGC